MYGQWLISLVTEFCSRKKTNAIALHRKRHSFLFINVEQIVKQIHYIQDEKEIKLKMGTQFS